MCESAHCVIWCVFMLASKRASQPSSGRANEWTSNVHTIYCGDIYFVEFNNEPHGFFYSRSYKINKTEIEATKYRGFSRFVYIFLSGFFFAVAFFCVRVYCRCVIRTMGCCVVVFSAGPFTPYFFIYTIILWWACRSKMLFDQREMGWNVPGERCRKRRRGKYVWGAEDEKMNNKTVYLKKKKWREIRWLCLLKEGWKCACSFVLIRRVCVCVCVFL